MQTKVRIPFNHKIGRHLDQNVRSLCGKTVKVIGVVKTPLGDAYRVHYNSITAQILAYYTEELFSFLP